MRATTRTQYAELVMAVADGRIAVDDEIVTDAVLLQGKSESQFLDDLQAVREASQASREASDRRAMLGCLQAIRELLERHQGGVDE